MNAQDMEGEESTRPAKIWIPSEVCDDQGGTDTDGHVTEAGRQGEHRREKVQSIKRQEREAEDPPELQRGQPVQILRQ